MTKTNSYISLKKVFCLIIYILLFATGTNAQKNAHNMENKLSALIDSFYVNDTLPGVVAGVWTPDFTYKYAVGKADLVTGAERLFDDKIRIGSITKTFVATVILQLVDEGKLNLDDRLDKYYPSYPNSSNITLRQMLDMSSGMPDYIENPRVLKSFIFDRNDKYTPQELFDITASMQPSFEPGKGWQYSNGNYNILGMLIEKITGNPLHIEIDNRIIKPLGLNNTVFPLTSQMDGQYSHGYMKDTLTREFIDVTVMDPSIGWAAGNMISNFDDLKIYAKALAEGTLISRSSQEQRLMFLDIGASKSVKYGLGILSMEGFIGHNGGITGYNTTMCYNPELKALIIISVNEYGLEGGASDKIFAALAKAVYPERNFFGN
ncbi:MAG: serine hydrolase domain-containing protein [Ignavibacteria bacterium]